MTIIATLVLGLCFFYAIHSTFRIVLETSLMVIRHNPYAALKMFLSASLSAFLDAILNGSTSSDIILSGTLGAIIYLLYLIIKE